MKMKCTSACQFRGDVVRRGAVLDLSEAEAASDFAKTHFVPDPLGRVGVPSPTDDPGRGGVPPPPAPAPRVRPLLVAGLTREQAIEKLRSNGVRLRGNLPNAEIVALYNATFSTIAEAAAGESAM